MLAARLSRASCVQKLGGTGLRQQDVRRGAWRYKGEGGDGALQVAKQLEMEKQQIIERKRREQAELKRKQEELDRILKDNKRKVGRLRHSSTPGSTLKGPIDEFTHEGRGDTTQVTQKRMDSWAPPRTGLSSKAFRKGGVLKKTFDTALLHDQV